MFESGRDMLALNTGTRMTTHIKRAPVRNGLRDITVGDLWTDPLIVAETLQTKLNGLPIDQKKFPQFVEQMRMAVELLRCTGSKRYSRFSLLALVDLLQAVHYFLALEDHTPDGRDDGYKDDAEVLRQVFARHEAEIKEFEEWFKSS